MYCLNNDQTHFKTYFTVHFIKNNSSNRRWPEAQIIAPIVFVYGDSADSVCFRFVDNLVLPDQFVLNYLLSGFARALKSLKSA